MTASATPRSIRSIMRCPKRGERLNIITFPTHERYESTLCKTGHNFYSIQIPNTKTWETEYAEVPENYYITSYIPDHVDFDLILAHTSCNRLKIIHDTLSQTSGSTSNRLAIPIIRHTHVLPDVRMDVPKQLKDFKSITVDKNSFISDFNRMAWGFHDDEASVVDHGIDTEFWKSHGEERNNICLSVVNDWPNRDWCCGFNLWKQTIIDLPCLVVGKSPGFSRPAESPEHLRSVYSTSRIFYNTSLHSPVPTVLLEAMSCGCAIVSTANCMTPDIITHGENGLISNDPTELRSYLEELLRDEEKAKYLGENARKTIESKFNIKKFCDNWNELFYSTIEDYKRKA
jgi:glycosyltransferase involved in cell wall biosynthesis